MVLYDRTRRFQCEVAHWQKSSSTPRGTKLSPRDQSEVTTILQELSEPLAAILSNAQAGQRILTSGGDPELGEVLSDIAEDGRRAGDLLGRLNELLEGD